MGTYQRSNYYDNAYSKGDYDVPPEEMKMYYMIWSYALEDIGYYLEDIERNNWRVKDYKPPHTIVDLGCGPGHFPSLLKDKKWEYYGYDFSEVAINKAKEKNWKERKRMKFFLMDLEKDFPSHENVIYCSFEFFEHVPFDLEVLDNLKKGDVIFFSVPSFDTESHVRFFKTKEEVIERYNKKLDVIVTAMVGAPGEDHHIYLCKGIKK